MIRYNRSSTPGWVPLLMPAVGNWEGTHAKGSCELGQAGRCSHKQRPLVQWISLSRVLAAGSIFLRRALGNERFAMRPSLPATQSQSDLQGRKATDMAK